MAVNQLFTNAAIGVTTPQGIQVFVIPDGADLFELETGCVHKRHNEQRAVQLGRIKFIDQLG